MCINFAVDKYNSTKSGKNTYFFMHQKIEKLTRAFILLTVSLLTGVAGFSFFENHNVLDAFYLTVLTISTVGFETLKPMSDGGKLFTSFYIILNIGIFAYVVSIFATYIFEGELRVIFKNFMKGREVSQMKGHTIVCGYDRNGMKVCEELQKENRNFVVIDKNKEAIERHADKIDFQYLIGDATADEVLRSAGIERAASIITTLPYDANNVFIALTARELNPDIKIIARASDQSSEKKLKLAGATHVIMPDALGGLHMARLITKPCSIEFLELLNGIGDSRMVLDEFAINQLNNEYQNKTIKQLDIRKKTGVSVLGLKQSNKEFVFNPNADTVINNDDILIILGTQSDINSFKTTYS